MSIALKPKFEPNQQGKAKTSDPFPADAGDLGDCPF